MPEGNRKLAKMGMGFAGIGMLLGAIAGGVWWFETSFANGTQQATGLVTAMERRGKGSVPVVKFKTGIEDQPITIKGRVSTSPPSVEVGETVTVLYHPASPEDGRIDTFFERFFIPFIFGILALVFSLVGLGMLVAAFKAHRKA